MSARQLLEDVFDAIAPLTDPYWNDLRLRIAEELDNPSPSSGVEQIGWIAESSYRLILNEGAWDALSLYQSSRSLEHPIPVFRSLDFK
jgi:hypothetical protein